MGYIIFFIFLSGCISNSHLEENQTEKQVIENPQFEDQIRAARKAEERDTFYRNQFGTTTSSPSDPNYSVSRRVKSSTGFGGSDDILWVGYENVIYRHEIVINVFCKDHEIQAFQGRPSYKSIGWKINEKLKGYATTNLSGVAKISFESDQDRKFEKLIITINDRIYEIPLRKTYIVEADPSVCKK